MNRLYQWLRQRATGFREDSREAEGRRMVRTEVTVEAQERTVLLSGSMVAGMCVCPLCGNPISPLPADAGGTVTLEHAQFHTNCPGPEVMDEKDPRLGKPRDTRRLR